MDSYLALLLDSLALEGMNKSEDPTFLNLTQEMPVVTDESGITRG